jgi:hypothetical protein
MSGWLTIFFLLFLVFGTVAALIREDRIRDDQLYRLHREAMNKLDKDEQDRIYNRMYMEDLWRRKDEQNRRRIEEGERRRRQGE